MRFTESRKAIAAVSGKIQQDLEAEIVSVEQLADNDPQAAAFRASQLATTFALNYTLSVETRFSLVDAILTDADKNGLPRPSRQ